jgi:hypothetical protein
MTIPAAAPPTAFRHGMINLRTDGQKVVLAQKLEQPRSNAEKWYIHRLEPGPDGCLRYVITN